MPRTVLRREGEVFLRRVDRKAGVREIPIVLLGRHVSQLAVIHHSEPVGVDEPVAPLGIPCAGGLVGDPTVVAQQLLDLIGVEFRVGLEEQRHRAGDERRGRSCPAWRG